MNSGLGNFVWHILTIAKRLSQSQARAPEPPFLEFDADPYGVLMDGKPFWIIDAYTTTTYYSSSDPFPGTDLIANKQPEREQNLVHGSTASLGNRNRL